MGKNQAYKAMQRAKVGSSSAAPDDIEDGMMDGSFHTPEWHAARLASLKTTHTITWEEYKKKQKEEELKKGELEADTDKLMREYRAQLDSERREYRAQLDSERPLKLSKGRNLIRWNVVQSAICVLLSLMCYPMILQVGRREISQRERTQIQRKGKAKRESIREGNHLTQAPLAQPLNHQVATKGNLGDQVQVLKDQIGRGNTNLEADTQAKVKMRLMVLYRYRNSLAVFKS